MKNYFNTDSEDDNFNPEDHNIEMDEIAKMYAMEDMKEEKRNWAREQANKFYNDFESLDISESIIAVKSLIETKSLNVYLLLGKAKNLYRSSNVYARRESF